MPIHVRGTALITDLLASVQEAPNFDFLYDWRPDYDTTFFPRLNNSPEAQKALTGDDRQKLKVAIDAVLQVNQLVSDTTEEFSESKGGFSNSISVFHRDGEVSVVAIPVTAKTSQALGGFLFAHDIFGIPNSKLFLQDLEMLSELTEPAEGYLKWRWWPVKKDVREENKRSAAQLLLAATNPSNRNVHHIADLVESRASISAGRREPELQDWHQALLKLESLQDLPADAVISTIDLIQMNALLPALELIQEGFTVRDNFLEAAKDALAGFTEERMKNYAEALTLDTFARRVKGQGFARKALSERMNQVRRSEGHLAKDIKDQTVGELMELVANHPNFFATRHLQTSINMLRTHLDDQRRILGYPRLSDAGETFEGFLQALYRFYLEQKRPYPARAQFDSLYKLLESQPDELHLVARNELSLKKLIGSLESYLDQERLDALGAVHLEPTAEEAREYFRENPATYQSLLSALGLNALTLEQISGFLAPELTKEIRDIELDLSGMNSPLRSYQHFGAQYIFHQRRVILGDEMGLGKTVTALAVATHLSNDGDSRFLVIVPNAVLENWRREIIKHSSFTPHVLHGEELEATLEGWLEKGGLALATFESIQRVNQSHLVAKAENPDLVVVDEAHYIKNPETKRSKAVLPWLRASERALLMSGTPFETKLEEFEILLHYVQPNLPIPEDKLNFTAFRKAIAPAYLRRNQVDVLHELPKLQEEEIYIELSEADIEYYRRALENKDYHAARQAKLMAGPRSSTIQRIQAIVSESLENNHKVLLFSYYRPAIDVLAKVLKADDDYIPLTGSLSSVERQGEVDKFTKAEKPGVLIAQAQAGGQGLNIQAASVVIIVEPQSKPSTEEQMIRRAYRMGQNKQVRVYHLRGKGTIDERWVKAQAERRKIFAATAGVSDAAALDSAMAGAEANLFEEERKAWGF